MSVLDIIKSKCYSLTKVIGIILSIVTPVLAVIGALSLKPFDVIENQAELKICEPASDADKFLNKIINKTNQVVFVKLYMESSFLTKPDKEDYSRNFNREIQN